MDTLRSLTALLLLAPALATAGVPTCPAGKACRLFVTSGTMTFDPGGGSFTVSGTGWTSSGHFPGPFDQFTSANPILGGSWSFFWEDVSEGPPGELTMAFTLGGVPWTAPGADTLEGPGGYGAALDVDPRSLTNITHPGIYRGFGSLEGFFVGVPASAGTCPPVGCTGWVFDTRGTVLVDVMETGDGSSLFVDQATWTFKAPEPSTASLLLLGFAGLALLARRRRSRAMLLPAV